jgi:predicted ester cyclase
MTADIKESARRVLEEIFPAADEAGLAELISDQFVNHEAPPGTPPGLGSVAFYMRLLAAAFADQKWTVHQALADGDTVALFCTHSGRHVGDYFGIAPTGRSFSYRQMHLIRFAGGKGVEHWAVRDDAGLMRQLTEPAVQPA